MFVLDEVDILDSYAALRSLYDHQNVTLLTICVGEDAFPSKDGRVLAAASEIVHRNRAGHHVEYNEIGGVPGE